MLKTISKLFGSGQDKDLKALQPLVAAINDQFAQLQNLSDDALRAKTAAFKGRIAEQLKSTGEQIQAVSSASAEARQKGEIHRLEDLFRQKDKLEEQRNNQMEVALRELLPEAFAVVKETARRLSEKGGLTVATTDHDREYTARLKNLGHKTLPLSIEGETTHWQNKWEAAGSEVHWQMVHYDVQLIGGIVLHEGKIAEMKTGEGKTLVSTLPIYLNALAGEGLHVVTVNDYLARRDCEWNGPLFEFHGLRTDCLDYHQPNSTSRRAAYYDADITYGTNNEFGFDYLRDNMAHAAEELVQRKHHYAIIDEIDSVLIDEARTPLIISGPVPGGDRHEFAQLKPRIELLMREQKKLVQNELNQAKALLTRKAELNKEEKKEAGDKLFRAFRGLPKYKPLIKFLSEEGMRSFMQKTESFYLQEKEKNMYIIDDELFFTIDEKNNTIELTDRGRELITKQGEDANLFVMPDVATALSALTADTTMSDDEKLKKREELSREFAEKSERLHSIQQLLKAYTLFEKDIEYIVQEGKVMIVDESTGRAMPGRRYSDGLHQAIEAKENVKVEKATQTYASITLQNYFRMYHKLAGMTGTAETEANEFFEIYKLHVVVIPTNRPIAREDIDDKVYKTKREKYNAIIDEIDQLRKAGRPILVGTTSVEVSEQLSRMLRLRQIDHNVLNAKHHAREAEIVAEAGQAPQGLGNVTIATNMAGRGTDIKLGPGVKKAGGLAIIGSERHESRRIDLQLRGRAGRQGDPGSSVFYISLEDDLMRLFGSQRIAKVMDMMKVPEGEMIQHRMITKQIANAQRKVEENHFGYRKRTLEYDDVMNKQREVVYTRRRNALFGERMRMDIDNQLQDLAFAIADQYASTDELEALQLELARTFAISLELTQNELVETTAEALAESIYNRAAERYTAKTQRQAGILDEWVQRTALAKKRELVSEPEYRKNFLDKPVAVELSDGLRAMRVLAPIRELLETKGQSFVEQFERGIILGVIDDHWKEHLRAMDDLRTNTRLAQYEQKDPLLIYKEAAFKTFMENLEQINRETISMLMRAELEGEEEIATGRAAKRPNAPKLTTSHSASPRPERPTVATNAGEQPQRPLSRRERRAMERQQGKRK